MNRTDLQTLADIRIEEARALLFSNPPCPDGAYYLAGYAVECALKACIAKQFVQHDWPEKQFVLDCHTHNLEKLFRLANLFSDRQASGAANPIMGSNFSLVERWNEQSRYERHSLVKAQELYDAITDQTNKVLPWIKARW